jgi:hypothetical protein
MGSLSVPVASALNPWRDFTERGFAGSLTRQPDNEGQSENALRGARPYAEAAVTNLE